MHYMPDGCRHQPAADINLLQTLSLRYIPITRFIHIIVPISIVWIMTFITLIHFIWMLTQAKLTFSCIITGCWTYSGQCFPTKTNWIDISWTQKKSILSSTVMLTLQTMQIPSIALATGPREGIRRGSMSRAFGQIRAHPRPRHSWLIPWIRRRPSSFVKPCGAG